VVEENTFTGNRTGILVFGGVDNVVKENLVSRMRAPERNPAVQFRTMEIGAGASGTCFLIVRRRPPVRVHGPGSNRADAVTFSQKCGQ